MQTTEERVLPTPAALSAGGDVLHISHPETSGVPNVQDCIALFITAISLDVKPATVVYYNKSLRPLHALGDMPIADVTINHLREQYSNLRDRRVKYAEHPSRPVESGALSPYTLAKYVRAWRRFFAWLVEEEIIDRNPANRLKKPGLAQKPPGDMLPADLEKIIDEAQQTSARDTAIVLMLADTGCRVGGLVGLRLADVDVENGHALVNEKGDRARFVFFGARTKAALKSYLDERLADSGEQLFIGLRGPLTPAGVYQLLKRLARRAGVTGRFNPHSMRHAWARQALKKSGDLKAVSQILGHSSVAVTAQFYAYYLDGELQERHAELSWIK